MSKASEQAKDEATARPWRVGNTHRDGTYAIHGISESVIHCTPFASSAKRARANASLIITAVNSHDELLEACRKAASCASINSDVRSLILAAIAKAEGNQ